MNSIKRIDPIKVLLIKRDRNIMQKNLSRLEVIIYSLFKTKKTFFKGDIFLLSRKN